SRRSVDIGAARRSGAGRSKQYLLNLAMGDVLDGIEVRVLRRNFDAAFPARRTVKVQGSRIVEGAAIDGQVIIMEALVKRARRGAGPCAVRVFGHSRTAPS